jgi:5-amino-6-(5-phospho-D-ribitylamino)uracil phosphatase
VSGRIRLLALDIDGTLLRSDKALSPRTRAAVDAARAAGVRLVLATGRRYPSARRVAEDLGGPVPLVLHNGALVMEAEEVVRVRPLPRAAARRAVLLGRGFGLEPLAGFDPIQVMFGGPREAMDRALGPLSEGLSMLGGSRAAPGSAP